MEAALRQHNTQNNVLCNSSFSIDTDGSSFYETSSNQREQLFVILKRLSLCYKCCYGAQAGKQLLYKPNTSADVLDMQTDRERITRPTTSFRSICFQTH